MDRVTAGGANVASSSDAQAAGRFALTGTTGNSVVAPEPSPYPGQPGLGPTGGAADGTALAVGTNLGAQGLPPVSASTDVVTAGEAQGNQMLGANFNHAVLGAGGVAFQVGWTFIYGAWIGL